MEGFGFVFEKWIEVEKFTDHTKEKFIYTLENKETVMVNQETFEHTKKNDHTGAVVWDDLIVLAKILEKTPTFINNKTVIELGAGTGLLGLICSKLGAKVVITDQLNRLKQINENLNLNSTLNTSVSVIELDWKKIEEINSTYDVILLSGCIYHEDSVLPLVNTILKVSRKDSLILLAVDFRYDVTEETEFSSPVISLFFEISKSLGLNFINFNSDQYDKNFTKKSIKVFQGKKI